MQFPFTVSVFAFHKIISGYKMKKILTIIFLVYLTAACSTSYVVTSTSTSYESDIQEFNKFAEGREAEIVLVDETEHSANEIYLSADSLNWINVDTKMKNVTANSEIREIVFKNSWLGGLEGFGFGTLGGLVLIGAIFLIDPGREFSNVNDALTNPVKISVLPVLGASLGVVMGHTYEYEFQNDQQEKANNK